MNYVSSENKYAIFFLASREILVQSIHFDNHVQFTTMFVLTLPQEFELDSPHLSLSHDNTHLIVYNTNGSILSYKWNGDIQKDETQYVYQECAIRHQFVVDDVMGSDCLSLEQQKQFEAENERKIQVQNRKAEILEIFAKLKNEFAKIKDQNAELPSRFQLGAEAFEIDERITKDLEMRTEQKFQVIQAELQRKIEKMRKQAERMEYLYLSHLEHWPVSITGFR